MSKTNKLKDKSQSGEIFAIYKTDKWLAFGIYKYYCKSARKQMKIENRQNIETGKSKD